MNSKSTRLLFVLLMFDSYWIAFGERSCTFSGMLSYKKLKWKSWGFLWLQCWPGHFSYTVLPAPFNVTAVPNNDNATISVSWKWNSSQFQCISRTVVVYKYEVSENMPMPLNTKSATSYTLQNLTCNRKYTIWVRSIAVKSISDSKRSERVQAVLPATCIGKVVINCRVQFRCSVLVNIS